LDVGKSRSMPAKFEFAPEPELGIVARNRLWARNYSWM
jgi:hypothetical protein